MAQKNVASDAAGSDFADSYPSKAPKELKMEIVEGASKPNRATAFTGAQPPQQVHQRSSGSAHTQLPRKSCPVFNQFNITGGTIGHAVIGSQGPVTFNKKQRIFHKGSEDLKYNITGGNFNQATIGGTTTYHNKGSTVSAGGRRRSGISPEDLTKCILEKGVTVEELAQLLEKKYTLGTIAFAIPSDPVLKKRMVKAMLLS